VVNPNRFYVYAFLRRDRTSYYTGKGSGKRAWKARHVGVKRPRENDRILLVRTGLPEEEAFAHEKRYIAAFGRKDLGTGILHNRTDGGDGASGQVKSEELRQKQRESMTGENNPMSGRSGESNPAHGKKWWYNLATDEEQMSKTCPGEGWVLGQSEKTRQKKHKSHSGRPKSEKHKSNIGKALSGENNPMYGKGEVSLQCMALNSGLTPVEKYAGRKNARGKGGNKAQRGRGKTPSKRDAGKWQHLELRK
jgi:hypothetical protein